MKAYWTRCNADHFSFLSVWTRLLVYGGSVSWSGMYLRALPCPTVSHEIVSTTSCELYHQEAPTLEEFVLRNDEHLYNEMYGLARLIDRAQVRLVNATSSLSPLQDALSQLDLTNEQRLRPSWDQYFMQLASLAAQRSNCMKRRVGCVLVRERRVISTGYNGTPRNLRNCNEGGCESSIRKVPRWRR